MKVVDSDDRYPRKSDESVNVCSCAVLFPPMESSARNRGEGIRIRRGRLSGSQLKPLFPIYSPNTRKDEAFFVLYLKV